MSQLPRWKEELRRLEIPAVDEDVREKSLSRALVALHQAPTGASEATQGIGAWMLAGGTVAALAAVTLLLILHLQTPRNSGQPVPSTALLTEMEKLFPQELKAVIVEGGEVSVRLAEAPEEMAADQRVRVTLTRGKESVDVLTYSGRKVCMDMDGTPICLTPLLTGENTIFVLTENSVVLPSKNATLAGYRLSVEHLGGGTL